MHSSAYIEILYHCASRKGLQHALEKRFGVAGETVFDVPSGEWHGNVPEAIIDWAKTIYDVADVDDVSAIDDFLLDFSSEKKQQYFYAGNQYDRSLWINSHFPDLFKKIHNAILFAGLVFKWGKLASSVFRLPNHDDVYWEGADIQLFKQALSEVLFCPSNSINILMRDIQFNDSITDERLEATLLCVEYPARARLVAQFDHGRLSEETASPYQSLFISYIYSLNILEISVDCTMLRKKIARRFLQCFVRSLSESTSSMYQFNYLAFKSPPYLPIDGAVVREAKVTQLALLKRNRHINLIVDLDDIEDAYSCANDLRGLETYEVTKACIALQIALPKKQPKYLSICLEDEQTILVNSDCIEERLLCYQMLERWGVLCEPKEGGQCLQ